MIHSKKTNMVTLSLAFLLCAVAPSANAIQIYSFSQNGFSGGGSVTGTFSATDINGDGQISSFNGEVSAYSMTFSGNYTVSSFSHSLSNLYGLVYDIGSGFIGDGMSGYVEGVASNWEYSPTGYSYASGYGPTGQVGGIVLNLDTLASSSTLNMVAVNERPSVPPPPPPSPIKILRDSVDVYFGEKWLEFRDVNDIIDRYTNDFVSKMEAIYDTYFLNYGIGASFIPNLGYSLQDAAQLLGFDHFNWLSIITASDPDTYNAPHVDPYGDCNRAVAFIQGTDCPNRDDKPWYLDEQYSAVGDPIYDDYGNKTGAGETKLEAWTDAPSTLLFSDAPAGYKEIKFMTCLVGVYEDGTGTVFENNGQKINSTCFDWTYSDPNYIELNLPAMLEGVGGADGSVINYLGFHQGDFDEKELALLDQKGIGVTRFNETIPEPATLALLGLGLAGIGFARRRLV